MPSDQSHNDLISTREASAILGRSIATVNRWADDPGHPLKQASKLPFKRGGRMFRRGDVLRVAALLEAEAAA
jgi:hypothetical protein